jgi:diguanylate cyclase (GGDEF)-like protein
MIPVAKRRILLIDDQASIHDDYRKIICASPPANQNLVAAEAELFGDVEAAEEETADLYDVDSALSGEDAIVMVERALQDGRPYAVAFVDVRMPPGLDGVRTMRRIWEIDPELLAVLCSAYSDYSYEDIIRELGRTDRFLILRKPFDNMEVRQCAAALAVRWMVARTDPLTSLLNRRSFQEHLRREWAIAVRNDRPLSCVMIDVDFFKSINDQYGHTFGDQTLTMLAQTIVGQTRPTDIVCRYGGEEFCILLPGTDEAAAAKWAQRCRQVIKDQPLLVGQQSVSITASFGVAGRGNARQEDLITRADHALRDAKSSGRDRVVVWHADGPAASNIERMQKYSSLFRGLAARDLMSTPVTCLHRQTAVNNAAELLLCRKVSSAPVVNDDGSLAGIVAERDIMEALGFSDGWSAPVERFMKTGVIQYDPQTPAAVIFEFLCRVQIHRVVIVEDTRPVGLISRGTFLRWAQNYIQTNGPSFVDENARPQMLEAAGALTRRAHCLQDELHSSPEQPLVPVVSGISSIQDIMADLLLWARCAQGAPQTEEFSPVQ